mmetsp:Transcript_103398/g.299062  ORF Transcript_103398/g.299062 Transcript_103398/m.299062 type:complete len:880 (-) Transcript_103398:134-2773(-)
MVEEGELDVAPDDDVARDDEEQALDMDDDAEEASAMEDEDDNDPTAMEEDVGEQEGAGAPDEAAAESGNPKARRGRPKDQNAPPRPQNPFQRFSVEARQRLKDTRPELASDLKGMAGALKEEWDKVPKEEKDRLQAEFDKEMEVWRPKWDAYRKTPDYKSFCNIRQDWMDERNRRKLIKRYSKDAPARPKSSYMIFASEIRTRVAEEVSKAGGGLSDIGKKISEEWAAVSEEAKAKYAEESAHMKEKFKVEYAEYKKTDRFKEFMNEKAKLESKQERDKLIRTKLADAPKKPPSAFALFRTDAIAKIQAQGRSLTTGELAKEVSSMWKALPDEEREVYSKKASADKEKYDREFAEFQKQGQYASYLQELLKVKLRENRQLNLRCAPKRPPSVFALFAEKHKDEVDAGRAGLSTLKQKFAEASEEEQRELEAQRKDLEEKYEVELKTWKESSEYKEFEKGDVAAKKEFKTTAAKVMSAKFLNGAPKAPPKSPFAIFVRERRAAVVAPADEGAATKKGEQVSAFLKQWKEMSSKARAPYEANFKEETKRWRAESKEFMGQSSWKQYVAEAKALRIPVRSLLAKPKGAFTMRAAAGRRVSGKAKAKAKAKGKAKGKAAPKGPEAPTSMPKRPTSAMTLFMREKKMALKAAAPAWTQLGAEGQKPYLEQHKSLQAQYEQEYQAWAKTPDGKKYLRLKGLAEKRAKVAKAKVKFLGDEAAPAEPKRPPSAYFLFIAEKRKAVAAELGSGAVAQVAKKLTDMWGQLPPEPKKAFEDRAAAAKADYEKAMAEYKASDGYKRYNKAMEALSRKPKGKAKAKAKQRASGTTLRGAGRGAGRGGAGRGRAGQTVAGRGVGGRPMPADESDSDAMGSDSSSDLSDDPGSD